MNKIILKKSHNPSYAAYLCLIFLVILLICTLVSLIRDGYSRILLLGIVDFIGVAIFIFSIINLRASKITIINDQIISNKKIINIDTVAGIKKIISYNAGGKYRGFSPIKDSNGRYMFTMVMLNKVTPEMIDYEKGDLWFIKEFKEHVLCFSVYDENVLNYMQNINSKIEVI